MQMPKLHKGTEAILAVKLSSIYFCPMWPAIVRENSYLSANMASRLLIIFQPRESVSQQHLSYWFPSGPTGLNEMRCTDVQLFASPSPTLPTLR
jgi:hypothetical protein